MKVSLEDHSSVGNLLNTLGIPDSQSLFYVVNGISVEDNYLLNNNDRIDLIPVISGG